MQKKPNPQQNQQQMQRNNMRNNQNQENEVRINEEIRAIEVRLVGDNVENGIYPIAKALKLAEEMEVDLVEIAGNVNPPVCKLVDYSKFLYEKKRREKEIKSNAQKTVIKEIRFTPETDDHDLEFKVKHAERFLEEGSKVKAYVLFKGRNILFKERGELLLLKFAEKLQEGGTLESMPKLEGKRMIIFLVPKKKK